MIAKLLALTGLYSLILAGLAMRFSGQSNAGSYNPNLVELAVVTVLFVLIAVYVVTRRPRDPLE